MGEDYRLNPVAEPRARVRVELPEPWTRSPASASEAGQGSKPNTTGTRPNAIPPSGGSRPSTSPTPSGGRWHVLELDRRLLTSHLWLLTSRKRTASWPSFRHTDEW